MNDWLEYVACPKCGEDLARADAELTCKGCATTYRIDNDIPILTTEKTVDTKLDIEAYAQAAAMKEGGIKRVFDYYQNAAHAFGQDLSGAMLEIGAGTGVLTEAMARHANFKAIIATDVSPAFATHTQDRIRAFASNASFAVCDGNFLPFRHGAFDFVLGRLVLHHILYYRDMLARVHDLLCPGGSAIFYEPIQTGKGLLAFMFRIILEIDAKTGSLGLTSHEKNKLDRSIVIMTKSLTLEDDFEALSKLEDKYVFSPDKLCAEARAIGYAEAKCVQRPDIDRTYFSYLKRNLKIRGIRPEVIEKVHWLKSAFADTIGKTAGDSLPGVAGYFVFRKQGGVEERHAPLQQVA